MYTVIQNVVKKLIGAFIVALDGLIHKVKGVYVVEDGVIKEVGTDSPFDIMLSTSDFVYNGSYKVMASGVRGGGDGFNVTIAEDRVVSLTIGLDISNYIPIGSAARLEFDYSLIPVAGRVNMASSVSSGGISLPMANGLSHSSVIVQRTSGSKFYITLTLNTARTEWGMEWAYLNIRNATLNGKTVGFDIHFDNTWD